MINKIAKTSFDSRRVYEVQTSLHTCIDCSLPLTAENQEPWDVAHGINLCAECRKFRRKELRWKHNQLNRPIPRHVRFLIRRLGEIIDQYPDDIRISYAQLVEKANRKNLDDDF